MEQRKAVRGSVRLAAWFWLSMAQTGAALPDAAITESPRESLSLQRAQEIAHQRNWDLLAAAAGIDLATAQKIVAREFPNPTLAISTMKISMDNHPSSTVSGNGLWERSYDSIIAINQLFEIGGKRRTRKDAATSGYQGARAQFVDARRT